MANIYQLWDSAILNSGDATPEQLEQKRNELKTRFESVARQKGVASKDIYATIDKFDQYSRQKTTTRDDGLTPDEREAARDDGSTILGLNKGGLKEGAKAIKDLGLGIVSSVPRVVGDLAQTWSDVGDNDPSEASAQLARKAYDASEDIKSNYSEGTKKAKKDFWSPAGLAMGVGENLGQIAVSGGLVGAAGKGAMLASKGSKAWGLGAAATTGMGLAYGQGYGQGKENALEKINKTSNEDLYAGVVNQFNEWNSGGAKKGSKPEIVSLYEEAEGDLNKMKDLMAEDAGAWAGILTAVTAPIAMGATAFMNRGAINEMAKQGAGNIITRNLATQTGARDAAEFSRRVATGAGVGSIAGQGLKIAGNQIGRQALEEGIQEGGEGYLAAQAGSLARGDKGVLNNDDWSEVGQQAAQGAAIGGLIGGGGSLLTMRDAQNTGIAQAKARTELPKQYQDSFNAFEDAKQAEAQAQAAHEANPTPESEDALNEAINERARANNQFNQYDAAFKQSFTEQEQKDLLANDLKGIAARAKLAEEAKQAELNSKAEQEALAKAQRANMVKGLAAYADNESVLINEVNQLGLDDTQKELLLREVFAESKNAKAKPQQTQAKTPLELAIDEHFDAKGNRKPSAMSSDIAAKHKVTLNELLPAIAKRMNDIKIQKAQAEKQAKVDAFNKTREQESTQDVKREKLTEKQQLENTLAEFAAENDTDSMLSLLDGYENKAEADKLFNNAFKTVETRAKEAEKATKAKEAETTKQEQAKQKQSAFSTDMSALYESNPNATYNDWKAIGKKYGVTSAIDLASAWANARTNKPKQKDEQKPKSTETLALPAPDTVMVADAQGNVIPTTENNVPKKPRSNDFSVPSGLKVDVSNVENTRSDLGKGSYIGSAMIVRQDGQPFPTEQVAQQALENKATKKPRRKNEPAVSKDTHSVVPVDGGFAIAPVEDITGNYRNKSSDDIITVRKTETGYDLDFDGVVQYYDGEDSLKKAKSFLRKYGFKKIKPKVESEWQATPKEPVVEQPIEEVKQEPVLEPKVEKPIIDDLSGDYAHSQFPDATATVTKTEKGYDINWGDEVQSFNGKNALEKAKATLAKEGFTKGKPKDDGDGGVTIEPMPKKPVSPTNTTQTTPKTTVEQIAQAMDKTAQAITEAAHNIDSNKKSVFEALTRYGWSLDAVLGGVSKTFAGLAEAGAISDGSRTLHADFDSRERYLAVTDNDAPTGGAIIPETEIDLRDYGYNAEAFAKAAKAFNEKVEAYALKQRELVQQSEQKAEQPKQDKPTKKENSKTDSGEQIASAMDKTAQAITDAAHSKVVERVKNGEEIVYKQPAAIERAKQDDRYQVEINDKGHAVVKNVKDNDGDWVKQDKPVTAESSHIDNGKIEEVTGEVIRESLAKVDDKPIGGKTINLKEAKQWLLDRANKALNEATIDDISKALRNEFDYSSGMIGNSESASERERKRLAKNKLVYEKLDKEIGYVTFDVPNDGSFRVLKTKKSLERFIKQVQSNKGFTETKKQSSSSDVAGQSPESVIKDFFSDRELDNAYEYSKLKGKPMRFGKPYEDKIPAYALTESFDVHGVEFFVGLSTEKEKTGANTYGYKWRVIEPKTGFAIGASQNTKKEAVDEAKKQLTKHVVDTNIEAAIAREVDSTIYVSESQREQKWLASIGHVTEDNVSAQKPQNINKKSAAIENLYDLALGAAKATQIKADRDKNKPVDFAANTFEDKWQKAINGDAKAIKDIRDYFVNNKRVPNMTKAHLIIFEGLTNQDFTSKTYEYVASKFDEYINGFSDVNTNNSSTQKFMPTFDDVMTHLKGIRNLTAESFKDAKTKAEIKNALEDYLDKVIPDSVSAKEFKAITDKFFNELVSSYPQTEHQSSGMLAHPIPEIAKRDNQPTNNSPQQADAPVKWFATELRAQEWINKQKSGSYKIVKVNNNKFEIYPVKEQAQDKSVQNNEPAPTKQPETKKEPKSKIDFSEASVKLEDVIDKWESIKKGDTVITHNGKSLIAIADAKGKTTLSFSDFSLGETSPLSIRSVTGDAGAKDVLLNRKKAAEQQPETKADRLIGKSPEGKDLYEDSRGVRYYKQGGVSIFEGVGGGGKTDLSNRTDEHRTVEEVAARQPKQPTKKESLLIKIDDELDSALDDLAAIFKEQGKRLSSGVDPVIMGKVLAIGMKASTLYLAKGAVKFAVWAENMINGLSSKGVSADVVKPYLKQMYLAAKVNISPEIRQQMDKEDDVYDFDFAILNQAEDETNKLGSDKLVFKNIDELKKWAAFNANNKKTPISFQRIVGVDDSVYFFKNKKEWESDTLDNTPLIFINSNQIKLKDTQNVTTPSQTNGTNARERDKTPESSQVQRASESGLTQDNTEGMTDDDLSKTDNQDSDSKPIDKKDNYTDTKNDTKTVTQAQIDRYNTIRLEEGDKVAQETLRAEMDALGFNSTERMHAWDALKAQSYQEQKDAVAAEKAAKKAAKAAKPSIKQIAESIIAKSYLFNQREQQFLNDIKTKRKLTDKQESWLRALAQKADVEIIGDFDNRKSKYENTNISFEDYVEDFLDMSVGLMSQQQKEDAYKTYQSWLDGSKPKFSQSSTIGDRTITQVRDKLISRFGKRIIDLLESKGILKIHQSMSELPKGVLGMARGTEDAAYYNGVVHLIADNLTDENIIPAFVHDLSGHKGFQEMMSPKAYELIMQQFYRLVAQGNSIAIKAKQRAERAESITDKDKEGKTDKQIKELEAMYDMRQQNEYIPYLLTEQVAAHEATPQESNAVKRLIDHILRAVKGWVVRTLSKYSATAGISKRVSETLDARDIQLMAERMIKDIAKYEKPTSLNKQSGMARREFLGLLGAGVGVAALGGGITLIDQSIKNNTKEAAKEKVNSLADNVYNELIKQLNKSDAFVKLAQNISTLKASIIGKNAAMDGFYGITDSYRMEKMYANGEQSNLIDTGLRYKDDGTPIFVKKDDVLKKAEGTHSLLTENEQKIINIMSDAIAFVEGITGKRFKKLKIRGTTDSPATDILARKKLELKNHDTNITARVEHDNPSVVLIHPQTMANLVSTNEKARLHAFQTLTHELSHVLQNQENDVNSDKALGVNIDTPVLLKNMIGNILESGYSSSEHKQQESEAFHIGYLATKALLLKEGKPLSTISKAEFLNLINASIDSFTTEQEVIDSFYRNVTFLDAAQFSKTEQAQFDRLLAKADKMIAEQGKLLAPNGKPSKLSRVQWAQVRTDNFKNWFGDWENDPANASQVIDSETKEPMVVYHGTRAKEKFTEFYTFTAGIFGAGAYFTTRKHEARGYSANNGMIYEAFINTRKPLSLSANAFMQDYFTPMSQDEAKRLGYDAAITTTGSEYKIDYVIAFDPTQIKSAIGNNGEFSPTNPDIRFSRAEDKVKAAKDYVLDSVRIKKEVAANLNAKKELGWWHKTLGTQQNTAIQHKDFGRVYKTLQRLLQHQSSDVTDALEVAPTLLEKLDDWKDFKNQAKSIGRNISQGVKHKLTNAITDRMAVAKVIFGETLAKKALTQDELEQKLNSQQLSMYEEARAAINVSLKNTAKSEIIRSLLQADAINFDTVEKHLNQQTGFDEFVDEMLENVGTRISNAQAELSQAKSAVRAGVKLITKAESDLVKATDKAQQKEIGKEIKLLTKTQEGLEKAEQEIKEEIARLSDMYNSISNVNNKVYQLIDEAYAPLMRFGDYALTMRDKTTGKVLSFMMFESKAERNRMVNYLGTEYGNTVDLETDTMSTEDFKQFKGVTPETVALFAKELGLDKNEAYQGYLKLAIPATSALTRRIQRKGTAGFNEDIQRVLASFVMSNARYSAKNIYLAKADREISEIESGASVRDQAKKMRDNTIDPVDTFAWLRDLLFVWNLGGSVMFAFLNMTQPFMQTIPMLSQYVNTGFATKHVLRGIGVAGKAMATGNAPKGYEAEYKRAVHEGIVDPQNTFMLTGLERGGTGTTSKVRTGAKHILGLFAQMSESLNRKAVFIASLEVANAKGGAWLKQKGYASAYDFAVDVISQTQGVYNKANRSNWAHNPVGAPLLVFKQFSINYVEQMVRMAKNNTEGEEGKKAVLLMLFMLFSLAGGMGLPFIKDIFDLSETTAAFFGNPINIEREMRLMGKEYFGETTTGALMDGWLNKLVIGEVLGADVQSRTGMGDLIPMTNVFNPVLSDSQRVNEAASIFGAAGGLGEKAGDSIQFAANDEWGNALINILPRFATSMVRGIEMMTTGETTDSKGRKLFDVTIGEGLVKFADSQPVRMAELSRARGLEYDDIAIQTSKIKYFKNKWVKAAQKEDMEAIEQIEQDIQEWNENNEKYPVIFDRQRAYQTANKNDMTWGEREAKPPRGMDWMKNERPEM